MASLMRKTAVYLGLVEDDEPDYDESYEDDYQDEAPARSYSQPARTVRRVEPQAQAPVPTPAPSRRASIALADTMPGVELPPRITAVHPRTYNEARTIGEHFRAGTPVIMNLSDMDDADAKRLVDFAAGLIFGLHGSIERITSKVFLLSPENVKVTPEDKERIAEGGFFNQS
jgi:cell division inhibitor SepF